MPPARRESSRDVQAYTQLQGLVFRRDVPRLEVRCTSCAVAPSWARDDLAVEWFKRLRAPRKRMYTLGYAEHSVLMESPDALRQILTKTVLPETYSSS